jgi:small conductance mechanosensitive channel
MVFRPFKVGDLVVASGINARVYEIDLFTTVVDTPDNRRLIIPNSAIAGHAIENVTFHAERRVEVPVWSRIYGRHG